MSRPKYFIMTEVMVYGGRTKYHVVKGFSDDDKIAKVGSERDATKLCEEFERLTDEISRLRKAGDELAEAAGLSGCSECFGLYGRLEDAITAWSAAKEGKPSV